MAKLNLDDIIALAKQGYKPSDIRDLLSITIEDPAVEDPKIEDPAVEDPAVEDPAVEDPIEQEEKDQTNYKDLYEQTKQKLDAVQMENTRKNIEDPQKQTNQEIIEEWARSFM